MPVHTDNPAVLDAIERALTTVVRHANLPRLRARMLEASGVMIDPAAYPVLRQVATLGAVRVGDLARALVVDVSTVSRQVRQLEQAGFVSRREDSSDGRVSMVALTRQGGRVMEQVGLARRALLDEVMAGWPPEEQEMFGDLLGRFAEGFVRYGETA